MISRRFFFHTFILVAVLTFSLVTVWASAETVVFRDSTGKTELVDTANPGAHAMPAGPWEMYAKAGGITFNVSYEDQTLHNGIGFDDAAYGPARRARVAEIFAYLNSVLNHTGVCDVVFTVSDLGGCSGCSGTLASAGTYYWQEAGFINGFAFDHITTGDDPLAGTPDIHAVVHFGWPWYQDAGTPSSSQLDLKSVLLHEVSHGLGLSSLTNANGTSSIFSGCYAKWDDLLETGNGKDLFGGNPPAFLGWASDLTGGGNGVRFKGANAMASYGSKPPIYAPGSWEDGSSIAHWNSHTTGNPVMEPAFGNGEVVRAYAPFEIGAMQDIGYSVVINSEGQLTVTLSPQGAIDAGARWIVNSVEHASGTSATLEAGQYTFSFKTVTGWTAPVNQTVTVTAGQNTSATGAYTLIPTVEFGFVQTPMGGWFEEGAKIDLSVSVRNVVGTVAYQWKKNGTDIEDETFPTYTMNPAVPEDSGYYSCQATDASKAVRETTPVPVTVFPYGALPVAGAIGLVVAALTCMGVGVGRIRRRIR